VTAQEYLRWVRENPIESEREARAREIELELVLADGTVYPYKGQFYVADREVNTQTGAIRLAGLFPNPGNILRPGQYVRVRAVTDIRRNALLVPQRAVTELGTLRGCGRRQGQQGQHPVGHDRRTQRLDVDHRKRSGARRTRRRRRHPAGQTESARQAGAVCRAFAWTNADHGN